MKRFVLLAFMLMLFSLGSWAGVRLELDVGGAAGSTAILPAEKITLQGQTGGSTTLVVLGEGGTVQTPPVIARFTAINESPLTLEVVTFDASASESTTGDLALFEWDLDGDGNYDDSSTSALWQWSFAEAGSVALRLRVTDSTGAVAISEPYILVIANRSPTARFSTSSDRVVEATTVEFSDLSVDLDGLIAVWHWAFGDGTTSTDSSPQHVYATAGVYEVSLVVVDNDGSSSQTYSQQVEVINAGPISSFSVSPSEPQAGQPLILVDTSTDSSPDGRIVHVAWDFGDGTYQVGGPSSGGTYSHVYTQAGTYTILLYIIDDDGAMALSQSTVIVH